MSSSSSSEEEEKNGSGHSSNSNKSPSFPLVLPSAEEAALSKGTPKRTFLIILIIFLVLVAFVIAGISLFNFIRSRNKGEETEKPPFGIPFDKEFFAQRHVKVKGSCKATPSKFLVTLLSSDKLEFSNMQFGELLPKLAEIPKSFGVDSETGLAWFSSNQLVVSSEEKTRIQQQESLKGQLFHGEFGDWGSDSLAVLQSGSFDQKLEFPGKRIYLKGDKALVLDTNSYPKRYTVLPLSNLIKNKVQDSAYTPVLEKELPINPSRGLMQGKDHLIANPKLVRFYDFEPLADGSFIFSCVNFSGGSVEGKRYFRLFPALNMVKKVSEFNLDKCALIPLLEEGEKALESIQRIVFEIESNGTSNDNVLKCLSMNLKQEENQQQFIKSDQLQGLMLVDRDARIAAASFSSSPSVAPNPQYSPLVALSIVKKVPLKTQKLALGRANLQFYAPLHVAIVDYKALKQAAFMTQDKLASWCEQQRRTKNTLGQILWMDNQTLLLFTETIDDKSVAEETLVWMLKLQLDTKSGDVEVKDEPRLVAKLPALFEFVQIQRGSSSNVHLGGLTRPRVQVIDNKQTAGGCAWFHTLLKVEHQE